MYTTKAQKITIFSVSLMVLLLTCGCFLLIENLFPTSHSVLITDSDPIKTSYEYQDLSRSLIYQGQPTAVDIHTSTIYIPCTIDADTTIRDLLSPLRLTANGYRMYCVLKEKEPDLPRYMRENIPFELVILNRRGAYMQYDLVFTSLPILSLSGRYSSTDPESMRDIYEGELMFWTPYSGNHASYELQLSKAQWHTRGHTSAMNPKPILKISLKKGSGKPHHLDLLGLGEEDDWLLNSMSMDDLKIRENLFMHLWNQTDEFPMSQGAYTEVLIDGEYQGLYLLQRRVDAKYLDLNSEDILLKGISFVSPTSISDFYELLSGPTEGLEMMIPLYKMEDLEFINLDNFINVNLFIQFANAPDNTRTKNMFYLWHKTDGLYRLNMIPWDTDLSFGLDWSDEQQFIYDSINTCNTLVARRETDAVRKVFPDFDARTSLRWAELRQNILSEKNILSEFTLLNSQLTDSGARLRDRQCWGTNYLGQDAVEMLPDWISRRLDFLDEHYGLNNFPKS